MNPYRACDPADLAELSRWRIGGQPAPAWLASRPDPRTARAKLVRVLDRPGRGGAMGRALARYLSTDIDAVYAEAYPRKAAQLAEQARARGEDPHADKLQTLLVALMHCANCGRPLTDPVSISRGIGPDCWPRINPAWRELISQRLATGETDVRVREVGAGSEQHAANEDAAAARDAQDAQKAFLALMDRSLNTAAGDRPSVHEVTAAAQKCELALQRIKGPGGTAETPQETPEPAECVSASECVTSVSSSA